MDTNAFANYDQATSKLLTAAQLIERQKVITKLVRPTANSNFKKAQQKRTDKVNSKLRQTEPIAVGSLVMLKDPTRTSKHQPIWTGPFRVVKMKKGGNYTLQCLDHSLYHRNPPRDQLKVIDSTADLQLDDIYYVERILDHKGPVNKRNFLIKWLNFPASDNTWEPESNLLGCESLLADYWATRKAVNEQQTHTSTKTNSVVKIAKANTRQPANASVTTQTASTNVKANAKSIDRSHLRRSARIDN